MRSRSSRVPTPWRRLPLGGADAARLRARHLLHGARSRAGLAVPARARRWPSTASSSSIPTCRSRTRSTTASAVLLDAPSRRRLVGWAGRARLPPTVDPLVAHADELIGEILGPAALPGIRWCWRASDPRRCARHGSAARPLRGRARAGAAGRLQRALDAVPRTPPRRRVRDRARCQRPPGRLAGRARRLATARGRAGRPPPLARRAVRDGRRWSRSRARRPGRRCWT